MGNLGSKAYAYIANYNDGNIYQCLIDPTTGLFTGCAQSGAGGLTYAFGIGTNTASNGNTYIYVRWYDSGVYAVSQCSINGINGQLSCNQLSNPFSGSPSDAPSIVFNTIGAQTYVYLPENNSVISRCNVNSDGTFSNCQHQTISLVSKAYGITFTSIGNQVNAFVADYNGNNIFQCAVSTVDGSLSNCSAEFVIYYPTTIASWFLDGQWFIYTTPTDYMTNVIKCSINNSTVGLENCADSGVGALFFNDFELSTITFANFTS